jgi:apolipoprotein N-acyltransferase
MGAPFIAFIRPLLSLVLFFAGNLLHPAGYMLAFIPMLEAVLPGQRDFYSLKDTFQSVYSCVFVFLFLALWWVIHFDLSIISALVFIAGSSGVMWLTSLAWRLGKATSGYFGFLFFWLGFEYTLLRYFPDFAPPSLGALMAKGGINAAWYVETGILGGTLWVLLVNLLVYTAFRRDGRWSFSTPRFFYLVLALLLAIAPVLLAEYLYSDSSIVHLAQSPWIEIISNNDIDSSAYAQRGEYIGLIGFWMGVFLAISVFVKQKTRLKFRGRT